MRPGFYFPRPGIAFGVGLGLGFFGGFGLGSLGFDWNNRTLIYNHTTYVSHTRALET